MRGESMKDKSKKSTYSTTFGVDPKNQPIPQPLVLTPFKVCAYGKRKPARGHLRVFKVVVRTGFEPVNSNAERIYSPRPLASWIPYLFKNLNFEATNIHI